MALVDDLARALVHAGASPREAEVVAKSVADAFVKANAAQPALATQPALTAADTTAITGTVDATVINAIANLRTRVAELESRLKTLGLLA